MRHSGHAAEGAKGASACCRADVEYCGQRPNLQRSRKVTRRGRTEDRRRQDLETDVAHIHAVVSILSAALIGGGCGYALAGARAEHKSAANAAPTKGTSTTLTTTHTAPSQPATPLSEVRVP